MSRSNFVSNSEFFYVRAIVPFTTGILFFGFKPLAILPPIFIYLTIIFFVISFGVLNFCYSGFRLYRYKSLISFGLYFLLFVSGFALTTYKSEILRDDHFDKKNFEYLNIVVNQEPQVTNKILMFKAKVAMGYENLLETKTTGNILISIKLEPNSTLKISYGDELIIPNLAKETRANPNPATFNYKNWLAEQHIYHQAFLVQKEVLSTGKNKGNVLMNLAYNVRARQVRYFREILEDDNVYSVASTLILGYRADLDEDVLSYYARTGTIHALSVSGMHVGLIYILLNWIFAFLNRRKFTRLFKSFVILTLIWSYTLLTGLSPSVLRAAIMISGFIIGKSASRSSAGYNILAFSAFLILVYDPYTIWDVGFQLSYLAVLGLIMLQPIIEGWFFLKNIFLRKIWTAISISIAAQVFTFPLSVYYFHQFPTYFLLSNLFILLPVTGIMYLGILILVFRLNFLAEILEWLIGLTNAGLKYIAELPLSSVSSIWISKVELFILTLAIGGILVSLNFYNKSILRYSLALCFVLQMLTSFDKFKKNCQKKIVIFNIRNYYAIAFIKSNEAILYTELKVDDKLFKRNIQPFLEQQHIKTIVCTENLLSSIRPYLKIESDNIQFYDYSISRTELKQLTLGHKKAIVKNID
ncbi:MAG: ComEC family competence protein [Pedobacter sp.]|nr:ComEC family competence protein [Pedobacter sp.]